MNWKLLKDTRHCIPAAIGHYTMFNKLFGGYIPVLWNGTGWFFINGDKIPDGIVRYWR